MTCARDFPTTTNIPDPVELSPALIRFVTDGLVATVDYYRAGQLPLHRFAWELSVRTDTLAELHPASRALTRLRWLQRSINNLHTEQAAGRRAQLSTDEETSPHRHPGQPPRLLGSHDPNGPHIPTGPRPAGGHTHLRP